MPRLETAIMVTILYVTGVAVAVPVTTAFTYQGQLKQDGRPADGEYDMRFSLYDAASGGNLVAGPLVYDGAPGQPFQPVLVTNGLFQIYLDFGNVYNGTALWLHIDVQPHGVGPYTPLDPRQPLSAAPFALYALDAPGGGGFWAASGTDIYNNNAGNVGIGTTSPSFPLHIQAAQPYTEYEDTGGGSSWLVGVQGPSVGFNIQEVGAGARFVINDGGNVGIGTSSPLGQLHIDGQATSAIALFIEAPGASTGEVIIGGPTGVPGITGIANNGNRRDIRFTDSGIGLWTNSSPSKPVAGHGLFVDESGNVGIGFSAPEEKLHIHGSEAKLKLSTVGNSSGPELQFRNPVFSDGSYGTIEFQDGGTGSVLCNIVYGKPLLAPRALVLSTVGGFIKLLDTGEVGIGASIPGARLHVATNTSNSGDNTAIFQATNIGPYASHIHYGSRGDWYIRSAAANGKVIIQDSGGNVGIGTNNPAAKLDVNGTARVKVLEIMGADLAERFPVNAGAGVIEPGTVMEIDPEHPGSLRVARRAYSSGVAGVVSGAGGLSVGAVLGNLPGGEAAPPIALSGRVWVRCDAGTSAIKPGDLLTSSDTPGRAMKASDRDRAFGTTLGKAMTGLASGRGLVLVLVNLN